MKFSFLPLVIICAAISATAQKELPAFGKINPEDLELKDCSFDPGANAIKLIDWGNIYFVRNTGELPSSMTIYERRVRIKILKEAGLFYANLAIPFNSNNNDEKILSFSAHTYNMEGNKIKKTTVYRHAAYYRKVNRQYSEMIVVLPQVKVGSVIEYKYSIQRKTSAEIKDWYFQSGIATRYSECEVSIPPFIRLAIQPLTADSLELKETTSTDRSTVKGISFSSTVTHKNFMMRNLPAIHNEPFMGSARDYLQRLSFRLSGIDYGNGAVINMSNNWPEVIKELLSDPDFGGQLNKKLPEFSGVIAKANELVGLKKKTEFLYDYVKDVMRWNGIETIYSTDGIKTAFQKKVGSSGDINLLLVAILNKAGVAALPILFSTRNNGLVNTNLPFTDQFNTVMALVEDEKKYYVLDATTKYSMYDQVPAKIINTKGLIAAGENGRWLTAEDTIHLYKVTTAVRAEIDSNAIMKGDVLITSSGYARAKHCEDVVTGKDQFTEDNVSDESISLEIGQREISNLQTDSLPLEQRLQFSMRLGNSGNDYYFTMNPFPELKEDQFLAIQRRTDIDFGYRQEYIIYGNYTIPDGYIFEELPQNISLIMPDTSIVLKRFINMDNNSLNVRITVNFKRSWYTAGEYPRFASFYKILLSKLNERVIIKKKDQL